MTCQPADPKMKVTTARVSGGRACARGRERYAWAIVGSGGGFEGDLVAQGLEFADVVAGPAVEVDAGLVVVGSEVDEPGLVVGEQMPDDHQDGPADGDDGFLLAAAVGDPPVPLTQERVGAADPDGGLAERPGQVPVAFAGAAVALLPAGGFA